MKRWLGLLLLVSCSLGSLAQDRTGVWEGRITVAPGGFIPVFFTNLTVNTLNNRGIDVTRGVGLGTPPISSSMADAYFGRSSSAARMDIIQVDDQMLAQLTSYGSGGRVITMYEFYVRPTPKEQHQYHFKAKRLLVNETERTADLFDMRGSFIQTDSGTRFKGIWENPFGGNSLGYFLMRYSDPSVNMNPELLYDYLNDRKLNPDSIDLHKFPSPQQVMDTLVTEGFSVDASLLDNGIADHDTLSIWLNGRLLDDNVVPGKKPFLFRVNLQEQTWNNLTIRCKSEGSMPGAGALLNINGRQLHLKYNLSFQQYTQADWVIGRKAATPRKLKFDE
ncbi:MAG: hypothetical protein GXC72_07325 [Chitinophagaceae bacterium]|nr:hypothetical protein [Chitinophagaceae bacterium]